MVQRKHVGEGAVNLDAQVRERILALIDKGADVLLTHKPNPPGYIGFSTLDDQRYAEWRSQGLVCLTQVFGSTHTYTESFASHTEKAGFESSAEKGLGILRAALEDVEHGYMETIQQLATAEVFADFIEQAEHLLENSYSVAAASVAGAVLENGLRSLAVRNDVAVQAQDDISGLNNRLVAKGVYNNLRRKQVAFWADVRNTADHGHFDDLKESDVEGLITGVRGFLADYL